MAFDWQRFGEEWRRWAHEGSDDMLEPDFHHDYDCPECGEDEAIRIFGYVNAHEGPEATDHEVACDCNDPPVMNLYRTAEEEEMYRLEKEYEAGRIEAAERRLDEMMSSGDDWRIF